MWAGLRIANEGRPHVHQEDLVGDTLESSGFLCHHLAVFPHVDRCPIQLGSSAECAPDALHESCVLRLPIFLHVTLQQLGASPVGRPVARSANDGLLIIHFEGEAQVFDHAPDFWGRCSWGCQIPIHEDRVGGIEGEGL